MGRRSPATRSSARPAGAAGQARDGGDELGGIDGFGEMRLEAGEQRTPAICDSRQRGQRRGRHRRHRRLICARAS